MKNSFFLIIPEQKNSPDRLKFYEPVALRQWLMDLPTANPGLATRLFHDFISDFNALQMDVQFRLDTLELLRPHYKTIEDFLLSSLVKTGIPQGENEEKIHQLLIALEREFTIGYWIAVRELTQKSIGWFQGKPVALAIQRVIKGLSSIVISHNLSYLPAPEWVWMDLHSLHRLCCKIKKATARVADEQCILETSSPLDSYKQIILLSLTDTSGLMQKEMLQVYRFTEHMTGLIKITRHPVDSQKKQCIILQDEDRPPDFLEPGKKMAGVAMLYLDMSKLHNAIKQKNRYIDETKVRFITASAGVDESDSDKLSPELMEYLALKWSGEKMPATPFFVDRKKRLFCIGLSATYNYLCSVDKQSEYDTEYSGEPVTDRLLSYKRCKLGKSGIFSIGSLVSFRRDDMPENKRSLAVICHFSQAKINGALKIGLHAVAPQIYPVTFLRLDAVNNAEPQQALIFGRKEEGMEKSYLVVQSLMLKDYDIIRLTMNGEQFPIILRDKKNIGLGYWQFECRRIEEKDIPKTYVQ